MPPNRRNRRRHAQSHVATVDRSSSLLDREQEKGTFDFIYHNSCVREVKVEHCIPLFQSRMLCESAVRMFMKAFDIDESGRVGYTSAGGLKVVVKIPDERLGIVEDCFLSEGRSEDEAASLANHQEIQWYGVVDGRHILTALIRLGIIRPESFQEFNWTVTIIEWQPMHILKAFARTRNKLQDSNVVQLTLYDTLSAIHDIVKEKANLSGDSVESIMKEHGAKSRVADEFSGGSGYAKETTRTLVCAASRIKPETLGVLETIMHDENSSLARKMLEKETRISVSEDEVFDARVYRNIISTNTIRGATKFLNADAEEQSNALFRLKSAFEENNFKGFQALRLNKETERSIKARRQVQLMNRVIGRKEWPDELVEVQRKLLCSCNFNDELDKVDAAADTILESLVTEYKARMPLEAGLRWRMYCRELESRGSSPTPVPHTNHTNPDANGFDDQNQEQDGQLPKVTGTDITPVDISSPEWCPLESLNIKCLNMGLERFSVNRRTEDRFHLVTDDPSQVQLNGSCKVTINEQEANRYINLIKNLLQEDGWVFLYTGIPDYGMRYKAFLANGFDPLQYPWPMVRNTDTVQNNTSPIPQNITDYLIGARLKQSQRSGFQPNTTSSFKRSVSSRKRKHAILDNFPEPRIKIKKPNTREPLRSNQRSSQSIAEFLDTFCPPKGNVLDAFAGTLTCKACYLTSRNCTAIEADNQCFDIALEKLKESARAYLDQAPESENFNYGSPSPAGDRLQNCDVEGDNHERDSNLSVVTEENESELNEEE